MAAIMESTSTPKSFRHPSFLQKAKQPDKKAPDPDNCATCRKKLPQLNENLLKDSLRMKSEIAHLSTQRKSLMNMLSKNEDFSYPLTPFGRSTQAHTAGSKPASKPGSKPATSLLIDEERYKSVMNMYQEVLRNRGLHDCERLHTNSRKREYKRWDYAHKDLAKYHLKPVNETVTAWIYEDEDGTSEDGSDGELGEVAGILVDGGQSSRITTRAGLITGRNADQSQDDEEEIPEPERVQLTVDRIKRATGTSGMLSEIHQIKERHKQLEALTVTKQRALADSDKTKRHKKTNADNLKQENAMKKYLLASANLQKEFDFNNFKAKTTVKLNRNFTAMGIKVKEPGVLWNPKWNVNNNLTPGKIYKSIHPVADANKRSLKPVFAPTKPGDLPPCVYLPKHIDAKTPVESAMLLDRFVKETLQLADTRRGY